MNPNSASESKTVTIEVHGLKAKIHLNRPEEDLIPASYLRKAEQTPSTNRPIWLFRGREDARSVNLNRWSTVDTRFRGVYKTLKKVPVQFVNGIYEDGSSSSNPRSTGSSSSSSSSSFSPPLTPSPRTNFTDAAKAQSQVVYALLHEILDMMRIGRRMGGASFVLRPRLFNCKLEYWTGYRERYTDGPRTAGLLCIDEHPETGLVRAVVPISSTQSETPTLPTTLTNEFKLLLSQLLIHIHHLYPPGDQIPSQEVYLISQHGPKLHLLRGIFPGHKTSRLWSGRYTEAGSSGSAGRMASSAAHCFASANPAGERYYGGANMERVRQELEWMALCCAAGDEEPDARTFRVLGSREFDLWVGRDFRDVVRLLGGLGLYLVSGRARCGVLQGVFGGSDSGVGEGREWEGGKKEEEKRKVKKENEREKTEKEDGREREKKENKEMERGKKEEEKGNEKETKEEPKEGNAEERKLEEEKLAREKSQERDALRQSWWDWVWEEGHGDWIPQDEEDIFMNGP